MKKWAEKQSIYTDTAKEIEEQRIVAETTNQPVITAQQQPVPTAQLLDQYANRTINQNFYGTITNDDDEDWGHNMPEPDDDPTEER